VQRIGGSSGSISAAYNLVPATANAADFSASSGVISWADGDNTDKTITLDVVTDANTESLERALIRLHSPSGGATLGPGNFASLYVGEAAAASLLQFSQASIAVAERGFATAVAVFERSGSAVGAASISYSPGAGDADAGVDFQGATSGTISWADGDADPKWLEFAIVDDGSGESDEFFELTLGNATGASLGAKSTLRVNIGDGTGINNAPNSVSGASQTVASGAQVTLNGSESNDPDGDAITYAWSQTVGAAVTLNSANMANATFAAPTVASDTLLRFELSVTDAGGLSNTSMTSVTVSRNDGGTTARKGGGSTGGLLLALLAALGLGRWTLTRKDAAG
jgi:hypothetical protein